MKNILLFLVFVCSQIGALQSFEVEARVAWFLPQDSRIRDIYGKNGFAEYELEASMPLPCCCECSCDWDLFTNLAYYDKKGHSSCLHDKTRVDNWTLNFGVKRYFDICECIRPYLGLGAGAAYARFHDDSPFVHQHVKRWGAALLVKSGLKYDLTCNVFLDLFADYSYAWFNFHKHSGVTTRNANTGGLKLGAGLGYQF